MVFSYKWLQEYFEKDLPKIQDLAELLTFHAFEIEGIEGDLIDIDVLPNRAHDCFCYDGIAREIAVLTNLDVSRPSLLLGRETSKFLGLKSKDFLSLKVEDSVAKLRTCPRAMKRFVQNVKVEESPDWLKEKLESIGQKSINNIVDITNFVMWETGQPAHCFDYDKLAGEGVKNIIIRYAKNGEKIAVLDDKEYELDDKTLVISDDEKALDIAGIKGGKNSEIDARTKNVILSVCNFSPVNIRKTSKRLNLRTDASVRFENGLTPEKPGQAMARLSQLIAEIAGAEIAEDILDIYPRPAPKYKVGVSVEEVNKLLGSNITEKEIEEIFKRFGFEFEKIKPIDEVLRLAKSLEGKSYKYGASVCYDAPAVFDCASFTAYLFAQAGIAIPRISIDQYFFGEKITKSSLQAGDLVFSNTQDGNARRESVEFMKGLKEEKGIDHLGLYLGNGKIIHASRTNGAKGKVEIENLTGARQFKNIIGYRRVSANNERFVVTIPDERLDLRIKEDLIEEVGRIYGYKNICPVSADLKFLTKQGKIGVNKTFYYTNKIKNILAEANFDEVYTPTFTGEGNVEAQKPLSSNLGFLRTNLSGGLRNSLELNAKNAPLLGLAEIKIFEIGKVFESLDEEYLSLAIGARAAKSEKKKAVIENEILENVKSKLKNNLGLDIDFANFSPKEKLAPDRIFEINLDKLIEKLPDPKSYENVLKLDSKEIVIFKKISPYPFLLRDIAVFASNEFDDKNVLEIIKENAGELLIRTKLFDTYSPEGENKTSYAFNLVFQSQDKTLTDGEVNKIMAKITLAINAKGWEVR
ncbi:MAG: C40 family peptidase [Candidatus Pacebacteria bacterium]|nr:C40 family peptidase [Candidatus Paceibacterota bacterium]